MKERKLSEVKMYTFNGIEVMIHIDFYNNKISIVREDTQGKYLPKDFRFSQRGVEYMNGWLNILEAMKMAIKEAKKEYEHELAETSKFKDEELQSLLKAGVLESRKKK